jgi:hypothetical protein
MCSCSARAQRRFKSRNSPQGLSLPDEEPSLEERVSKLEEEVARLRDELAGH